MRFDEWSIRPATADDARQLAEVHVASWNTTYGEIFPRSVLEASSVDKREAFWKEVLAPPADLITLAACGPTGEVVGFACGGQERTDSLPFDGELQAIYLLKEIRGQGLGTLLLRSFAWELRLKGFSSMAVWVLERNPHRKFYETLGASVIGTKTIEFGGENFVEIAYGWADLSTLALSK